MPPDPHRLFASIVIGGAAIASAGCSCAESHERDAGPAVDAPIVEDAPGADAPGADAACEGCEPCSSEPRCEMCFPCIL